MRKAILYSILIIAALAFLYPFLWMISASLSEERSIEFISFLPVNFTLDHYIRLFENIPIFRSLINSIIVSGTVTMGVIVFSSMVGYALARHRFKGRNLIFYIIIFSMTLPFQLTVIPSYILMVKLDWTNSFLALIIPGPVSYTHLTL